MKKHKRPGIASVIVQSAVIAVISALPFVVDAANEVRVTTILTLENGNFENTRSVQNYLKDQAGTASDSGVTTSLTDSTNALPLVNVTLPGGYIFLRNLDTSTSNSIMVSLTIELGPGDTAILPTGTTNILHFTTNGPAAFEYWVNAK